jgi:hypothetical protein
LGTNIVTLEAKCTDEKPPRLTGKVKKVCLYSKQRDVRERTKLF